MIVLGNGNPGSIAIDKRQDGSKQGIKKYNAETAPTTPSRRYPDGEFGELTESIQKWTAQFDEKGDDLVAAIGTGNPTPIFQAHAGARHEARPDRGRLDRHPAGPPAGDQGRLGAVGHRPADSTIRASSAPPPACGVIERGIPIRTSTPAASW